MPTGLWLYAYFFFLAVIVAEAVLILALVRQTMRLHQHLVVGDPSLGLPLGALAPVPAGQELFGRSVSLGAERGRKTLVFFLSTGCSSCRPVMSVIPAIVASVNCELILVLDSNVLNARLFLEEHWRDAPMPTFPVVADHKNELGGRYRVVGVPYAVVIDEDGRIGAHSAATTLADVHVLLLQSTELRRRRWASGDSGGHESRWMGRLPVLDGESTAGR
jgi:methylamine dehydrogenase accessory protein MauD